MSSSETRIHYLLHRYWDNRITEEEKEELLLLVNSGEKDVELESLLRHLWEKEEECKAIFSEDTSAKMLRSILGVERSVANVHPISSGKTFSIFTRAVAAAAVIIIMVGAGLFFFNSKPATAPVVKKEQPIRVTKPAVPGGNKAILLLADGTEMRLDEAENGTLAQQGDTKILNFNGQLAYNTTGNTGEVFYNTVLTPRGGQYQIVLPDGTKVWLNAASSLKFPTAFVGDNRSVELTGEGYFEVAKKADMPFIVKANDVKVQVFGTHFNVMAYAEESTVNTTLLEGSVKVTKGSSTGFLKPGQEAKVDKGGTLKVAYRDNIEDVVAWKDGVFQFNRASIQTVMRQISRWYDVEVVYQGKIPDKEFVGKIPRNAGLRELLRILEASNLDFKNEGKRIIVMP